MAQNDEYDIAEGAKRYPDVVYRYRPGNISKAVREDQSVIFHTENDVTLRITVYTDNIIRLNYLMEGDSREEFSYAIDPDYKAVKADFIFDEQDSHYRIVTRTVECRITKKKLLVHFYDRNGAALCRDKHGFYRRDSLMKGISEVKVTKEAPEGLQFFGLGDKTVDLNLRGRAYENWNTDSYAYKRGQDPLYRSVPFYMGLYKGRAYGIFFDNTYRTRFSFDRKKNYISSFSAKGGQINYYFINGPELVKVAERYAMLTGTPELPPLWSFGYHQCRWSYYPESRVREIARSFRQLEIPCDAIYLDIDYMDDYKVFTWNEKHFPDPGKLIGDLKKDGFQTIVMIDPGVRAEDGYKVYEEGKKHEYFCKRPDGEVMIGPVWPPKCAFPDFTNPSARDWWGDQYDEFMNGIKVSGIWNDMNEPAVFEVQTKTFPDNIRHNFDGHPCSHKKAHNIYGMQMARASLAGMKKHAPDKRPFLLTRANYAGGQRYAALWTGDNIASWDHLRLANEQCQRLSISGYSFCGSDIGGFVKTPSPELYTRWIQLGIFHPLFRTHSMGYNVDGAAAVKEEEIEGRKSEESRLDQEPWSFGDDTTIIARKFITFRYRLLTYLYTAFKKYIDDGTPVLKPLVFLDQNDSETTRHQDQFLFGDHIMVSPILEKGIRSKDIYIPKGNWYHYWDGQQFEGKNTTSVDAPLDQIPIFIRAGSVIPLREAMQFTGEKPVEQMELLVYHGDHQTKSHIYEDSGEGYDYLNGAYLQSQFEYRYDQEKKEITLRADREGTYQPEYENFELTFIGVPMEISNCEADGETVTIDEVERNGAKTYRCKVTRNFNELKLSM